MNKQYISEFWNKGVKGHLYYDFVDAAVNDDNLLFIDPLLIETADDEWCQEAYMTIKSFFDEFYKAYREEDIDRKRELLSHGGEQNGTRFGYGRGDNGKGNTVNGLLEIFDPLEKLLPAISTMKKVEDLPLLIPDFAEDGLSDLLTNILHEQLNKFTLKQMKKYSVESNGSFKFWTWDVNELCWKKNRESIILHQ